MFAKRLIVFLPLIGSSVAGFFGRFLGSEGSAIMTTGRNLVLFAILILSLVFVYRVFGSHLKKYGSCLVFIDILILFCIYFFDFYLKVYLLFHLGLSLSDVFPFLIFCVGGGQGLPLPAPEGASNSPPETLSPRPDAPGNSASFHEDSTEMDILVDALNERGEIGGSVSRSPSAPRTEVLGSSSMPGTPLSRGTSVERGPSVTQPEAGPANPGNAVANPAEEAGPANQPQRVVPYPYPPDEVIGGGLCYIHTASPFGSQSHSICPRHRDGSDSRRRPIRSQGGYYNPNGGP